MAWDFAAAHRTPGSLLFEAKLQLLDTTATVSCNRRGLRGTQRRTRHAGNAVSDQLSEIEGPERSIRLAVDGAVLAERRETMQAKGDMAWKAFGRKRVISQSLKACAALTTNGSRGAVRDIDQLTKRV